MLSKTEFWNTFNDIKFSKTLKLKEYVFNNKSDFMEFINKIALLLGDKGVEFDIILKNEFGSVKLDTLHSLNKYIHKYNSIYSLYITILNNSNKKCNNAIQLAFEAFENKNVKTYINIYSDQESWIIKVEDIIIKEYLPRRNYLAIIANRKVEFGLYFFSTMYLAYRIILDNFTQEGNGFVENMILVGSYKIKVVDIYLMVLSAIAIQFFLMLIREIFIPTFTIKGRRKSSFAYRFNEKMKEPYNLIGLIIGVISLILGVMSIFK